MVHNGADAEIPVFDLALARPMVIAEIACGTPITRIGLSDRFGAAYPII
jgi:hypothetical protein